MKVSRVRIALACTADEEVLLQTLILTEKPSVARDFAKALGIDKKKAGYFEGNGYVITWAIGHLVALAEPGDYDSKWKSWSLQSLPILPERLRYKPIPDVEKQLQVVLGQIRREDVGKVVIATDAGREGEVIARTILFSATGGDTLEDKRYGVFRFWTSQALTPQVVLETLKALRPASEFDRLWNAGRARQIADWLVGMNLSRAATLRLGSAQDTFSVGRVQTAVLALLVDRRRAREAFKAEPYWILRASFENPKGTWHGTWFKGEQSRLDKREDAEQALARIQGLTGKVQSVKRAKKKQPPPLLYSLTELQREANSRFGLPAKKTLDLAQGLYEEKKCLSYPRTDSRVLGSKNVEMVKNLVERLSGAYPDLFRGVNRSLVSGRNKRVFNDEKLTDHHAMIPLAPLPHSATRQENQVYDLVCKRFAAVFHPHYEYEAAEVVTEIGKDTFRTRGIRPLVTGWKAVYGPKESSPPAGVDEPEEEDLPQLEKNDPAGVADAKIEERMTLPPPEYTEALLLKDMTNPSRYVSEEELQKIFKGEVGLGTQATRAQIIETLIHRRFVARQKKALAATDKGCYLIERLRRLERARAVAAPEETARWEMELEKIAIGAGDPEAFIAGIRKFVKEGVEEFKMSEEKQTRQELLGKCPACGGEIIEGKRGFGCKNWREPDGGCRFVVWKEIAGSKLTPLMLKTLLSGGITPAATFRSKEGKEFSASLKLEHNEREGRWETRFVSPEKEAEEAARQPQEPSQLGQCPRCGAAVEEGPKAFGCRNWRQEDGGCRFTVWKTIAGRQIPRAAVQDLLTKGETQIIDGFMSKKGKEFSARLKLEGEDYKTVFVFGDPLP